MDLPDLSSSSLFPPLSSNSLAPPLGGSSLPPSYNQSSILGARPCPPSQPPKASLPWKSLLQSQADKRNVFSLSHISSNEPVVAFTEDQLNAGIRDWELSLIGHAIGKRPYYGSLLAAVKKKWALKVVCSQLEQLKQPLVTNKAISATPVVGNSTSLADAGEGKIKRFNRLMTINPRRILLLFASMSSMGTMILIYFTLAIYRRDASES